LKKSSDVCRDTSLHVFSCENAGVAARSNPTDIAKRLFLIIE